jgi:hypothetical protein
MKDIHIISNPISQTSTVLLHEEEEPNVVEVQACDGRSQAQFSDVVKIIQIWMKIGKIGK